MEMKLIRLAQERGLPIFGICRGLQLINVAFGGTLYQDLPSQYPECIAHAQDMSIRSQLTHRVDILGDTLIGRLLGSEPIYVNSYHHQAVKEVAKGFHVSAKASDGVAEAIENGEGMIYAVQWHPEELVNRYERFRPLFKYLVEQARK